MYSTSNTKHILEQIAEIDKYTLARALCDAMDNPTSVSEKAMLQRWDGQMKKSTYPRYMYTARTFITGAFQA